MIRIPLRLVIEGRLVKNRNRILKPIAKVFQRGLHANVALRSPHRERIIYFHAERSNPS